MSACADGHTTQPCPGCGTCIMWVAGVGQPGASRRWAEHDWRIEHTPARCRELSGVKRLVEAARSYVAAVANQARVGSPSEFIKKSARRLEAFDTLCDALKEVDRDER